MDSLPAKWYVFFALGFSAGAGFGFWTRATLGAGLGASWGTGLGGGPMVEERVTGLLEVDC